MWQSTAVKTAASGTLLPTEITSTFMSYYSSTDIAHYHLTFVPMSELQSAICLAAVRFFLMLTKEHNSTLSRVCACVSVKGVGHPYVNTSASFWDLLYFILCIKITILVNCTGFTRLPRKLICDPFVTQPLGMKKGGRGGGKILSYIIWSFLIYKIRR